MSDLDIVGSIQQGPSLSQLVQGGLGLGQQLTDLRNQAQMRQAYSASVDPTTGKLNQEAFLSQIGKANPQAALQYQKQFNEMAKQQADSQSAQADAAQKQISQVMPTLEYLKQMPEDKRAAYWPQAMGQLKSMGIDTSRMGDVYDPKMFNQAYLTGSQMKDRLDAQKTQAEIGKLNSDRGQVGNKMAMEFKDDLDPDKARGGNLAQNQARVYAAQRLKALLNQTNGNPDRRQIEELAIGAQSMLSNGNGSVEQVKALVPKSAWGDKAKMWEWFSNDPQGTNQQEFVKRMGDTIDREQEIASSQVKNAQIQRLGAHKTLMQSDPQTFWSIAGGYGINPNDIQGGKYVNNPSAILAKTSPQQGGTQGGGSGGILEGSAYAAPPPSGMLRMKGPDGRVRLIPQNMKGEAIAAGGSVVK